MVTRNIQAGEKLKNLRKSLLLSRETLHQSHGFSRSTIKHWENGNIDPTSTKFKFYLDFIKQHGYVIDIKWLLEDNVESSLPYIKTDSLTNLKVTNPDSVCLIDLIKILEQVSNFCYYINLEQQIMYFNKNSIPLLIKNPEEVFKIQNIKLQNICDEKTYEDCLENYHKALKGNNIIFDYPIQNSIIRSIASDRCNKMIYTPITNTSKKVMGVASCFLTNL